MAGRRWRVGGGGSERRVGPAILVDGRSRMSPRPELETRVARNRSTGSTRPATPNHPVGDSSTASGPVGGASHVDPTDVEPKHVEPKHVGRRTSGDAWNCAPHCAGEVSVAHVTVTAGEHQANGAGGRGRSNGRAGVVDTPTGGPARHYRNVAGNRTCRTPVCAALTSAFGVRSLCPDLLNSPSTADAVSGLADSVRKTATAPSERLQTSLQRADAPWPLCKDKASRRPARGSLFRATNAVFRRAWRGTGSANPAPAVTDVSRETTRSKPVHGSSGGCARH